MIEGLRLLPWFHHAARRDPDSMAALKSCETCMQTNTEATRREMGCGFAPPLERRLPAWRPSAFEVSKDDDGSCAGYLVRLPQVIEVARAYSHWQYGELAAFCDGPPSELLLIGLEILSGSIAELNQAILTPASKGGLAAD